MGDMNTKILHIVGNRPQFIKLFPFLKACQEHSFIDNIIVHSGQHYDYEMSQVFFNDLNIPEPDYSLGVGSGTHGMQTGKMLQGLDSILIKEKPSVVIVYGDTNTTLAGALAAYKLNIPVAHVESGMREYIWRPEEINKKIADHCSDFCFCPFERAKVNLIKEGIPEEKIFNTGDITYDAFCMSKKLVDGKAKIVIPDEEYIVLTMHRAETVDVIEELKPIIEALLEIKYAILYPIHPRTYKKLEMFGLMNAVIRADHITLLQPQGYFDFLKLLLGSKLVMTDSSGVLKEAFYAKRPCVTLDCTTEYKEIFDLGYNILAGHQTENILESFDKMLEKELSPFDDNDNPFGDGHASKRMLQVLLDR